MGVIEDLMPVLTVGELRKQLDDIPKELDDVPVKIFRKDTNEMSDRGRLYCGGTDGRRIQEQLDANAPLKDYWVALFSHSDILGVESNIKD